VANAASGEDPDARRVFHDALPTEMIYVLTLMVVASRSTIIETVSRKQFETAVAHLEARHRICARSSKTDNSWSGQMAARQWSPGCWPPPVGRQPVRRHC